MTSISRGEFLKTCLRWSAASVLFSSGFFLLRRSWREENQCRQELSYCRRCARLENCFLPAAASLRKVLKQGSPKKEQKKA